MPTLAECFDLHKIETKDAELIEKSYEQLIRKDVPAGQAEIRAVRQRLRTLEDQRDTFLDNIEKTHNVVLERPERMPAVPERIAEKKALPERGEAGIDLRINFPLSESAEASLKAASQDPVIEQIARNSGTTTVSVDAPYTFELSQQGAVTESGVIRLNPNARNIQDTFLHELGHQIWERGSKEQKAQIEAVLDANIGLIEKESPGYARMYHEGNKEEAAAELYSHINNISPADQNKLANIVPEKPIKATSHTDIAAPEKPEIKTRIRSWEQVHKESMGYMTQEDDLLAMAQKYGDDLVSLEDVNGGHYRMPASIAAEALENPLVSGHIKAVIHQREYKEGESRKPNLFSRSSIDYLPNLKKGFSQVKGLMRLLSPADVKRLGKALTLPELSEAKPAAKAEQPPKQYSFQELAAKSDAKQKEIDALHDRLDEEGVPFEEHENKSPELARLYEERISIDTSAAQKGYDGARAIFDEVLEGVPEDTLYQSIDGILRNIYALTDKPSGGVYFMSKYTGEALDKAQQDLAKSLSHLILARDNPNADYFETMERFDSGLTDKGKRKILQEANEKASKIQQKLRDFFTEGMKPQEAAGRGQPIPPKPYIDLQAAPVPRGWDKVPGREKPKPITVERAAEIAKQVYQREGIQSPIRILNNPYDLPPAMLDALTERYGGTLGRPAGLRDGKIVYVFVDNIKNEEALEETIIHELLHVGNDRRFGARLKQVMERLYDDLGGQEEIQKIADKYGVGWFVGRYWEGLGAANWEIASELVSFVGMKPEDTSLPGRIRLAIKRAYGALRQLLREYGFLKSSALNEAELSQFIKLSREAAKAPATGIEPIMTMQWGIEMESVDIQDIALQMEENQDNSNLYANRPSQEVDSVVQAAKDYIAGRRGTGIGSEVVEHYGFWDRFIGTIDNIAAKNPNSPMPLFFDESKKMRMDQDETFALTNVAVKAFNRLKKPQQAKLKKALIEGTLIETDTGMGREWNQDTLRERFGLDGEGIQSYEDIRAYLDEIKDRHRDRLLERVDVRQVGPDSTRVLDSELSPQEMTAAIGMLEGMIQNETDENRITELRDQIQKHKRNIKRIELGNKIIKDFAELQGYFPLMRFGDYTIAVRKPPADGEEIGELVYFYQAESKAEMRRKAGQLRRIYPDAYSVDTGRLEKFTGESLIGDPRLMSMLRDYVEMAGEGIEIIDAAEQVMLKKFAEHSFRKRMIHRKGIPGYSEDINRVLAAYGWSASNYLSKLKFIPRLQVLYEKTDEHKFPQIREHMGTQIQYMRGGTEGSAGEEFAWFKSMTFAMYMGLNVKSAVVNLTQVPMVLYPYLAGKYSDAKAIAAITRAQKAAAMPKNTGYDVLNKLMEWGEKEGIFMDMYLSDLMGMARGKRLAQARLQSKAVSGLSFMFSHAERFNRRVSGAAEYFANPNRSLEELKIAIEKTVRTTQFDYGKHNRGRIFQGWTSMPMQFHQFTVNYLQFLNPKKHGLGTTMRAMGMLWLAAGVMATPGADDLRAFIEFMAQKAFGTHINLEMWARKAIVDNAREYFGSETAKTIAESVLRGQGAYLAGDIAGSLSNSRLIPGFSKMLDVAGYRGLKEGLEAGVLEAAGAGPGFIANSLRGIEDALKTGDIRRAAERGPIPVAVQNFLKAVRTGTEGVDRDVSGRVQIAYSPTLVDSILQGMSIQPSERSRLYRIKNRQMRESAFVKGQHSKMLVRLAVGYAERDISKIREARADIRRWNRMMPRQWRLSADKVKRSIKARRRRFDTSSITGMEPILKQLRPLLRAEQARYFQ